MESGPIHLAILDDHVLFRSILKRYLSELKNTNLVIDSASLPDLLTKLKSHPVDVLIMDLSTAGLHGSEAIGVTLDGFPNIKILIISTSNDLDLISELLDAGIHGIISKSDEPEELLTAIHTVAEGRIYHNNLFTEASYWNKQAKTGRHATRNAVDLNERDKKVLQLLWQEKSNKEIANELFIGVRSVEKIRQDIKEKIGAKSIVGLLKYAIDKKIIQPSD